MKTFFGQTEERFFLSIRFLVVNTVEQSVSLSSRSCLNWSIFWVRTRRKRLIIRKLISVRWLYLLAVLPVNISIHLSYYVSLTCTKVQLALFRGIWVFPFSLLWKGSWRGERTIKQSCFSLVVTLGWLFVRVHSIVEWKDEILETIWFYPNYRFLFSTEIYNRSCLYPSGSWCYYVVSIVAIVCVILCNIFLPTVSREMYLSCLEYSTISTWSNNARYDWYDSWIRYNKVVVIDCSNSLVFPVSLLTFLFLIIMDMV